MSAYSGPPLKRLPSNYDLPSWMEDHLDMTTLWSPPRNSDAGYRALEQQDTESSDGIRRCTLSFLNQLHLLPVSEAADGYAADLDDIKRAILPDGRPPTHKVLVQLASGTIPADLALHREHLGFHSSSMVRLIAVYDVRGPQYSRTYVPFNIGEDADLGKVIGIIYDHRDGHWCTAEVKPGARLPQPCLLCWKECAPTIAATAAHRRIHDQFSFWMCDSLSPQEETMDCGCIEDSGNALSQQPNPLSRGRAPVASSSTAEQDRARGRRSRSPSFDPRYPTLGRDWYAARKDKWRVQDMEWWDAQLRRVEAQSPAPSSAVASAASTLAPQLPPRPPTPTLPPPTFHDEVWIRSAEEHAAWLELAANNWRTNAAAVKSYGKQEEEQSGTGAVERQVTRAEEQTSCELDDLKRRVVELEEKVSELAKKIESKTGKEGEGGMLLD